MEVAGADAFHWADDSAEYVVEAVKHACGFDGHDVLHVFYDAYRGGVALGIGAYFTHVGVGYVVADFAVLDVVSQHGEGLCQGIGLCFVLAEQVQDKS